jgi:hypothetical protein
MKRGSAGLAALAITIAVAFSAGAALAARPSAPPKGKPKPQKPAPAQVIVHESISALYQDGTTRALAVDRGRVTEKSASAFAIKRADAVVLSFKVDKATKVFPGSYTALKPNDAVKVVSESGLALYVHRGIRGLGQGKGPQPGKANQPALLRGIVHADVSAQLEGGTTLVSRLDRGFVAGLTTTSVTVERPDKVQVTLSVDSATKLVTNGKASRKLTINTLAIGGRGVFFSDASGHATLIRYWPPRPGKANGTAPPFTTTDLGL